MVEEMACIELVERVTDYLEGVLAPEELARLQAHLPSCDGCQAYLEQMRTAVRVLEATPGEHLPPEAEDRLTDMFREWAQGRPTR
jgi:predicted anti-sigma-YlaC factor YlaD